MNAEKLNAKEYLYSLRGIEVALRSIERARSEIYNDMLSIKTPVITDMPRSTHIGDISDKIAKYEELTEEFNRTWDNLLDRKQEALKCIARMTDPISQAIITERYLNRKSWRETAKAISNNEQHVRGYLHSLALKQFSAVYEKSDTF